MSVSYQILYKGQNRIVNESQIIRELIRILAEDDFNSILIEKVKVDKGDSDL